MIFVQAVELGAQLDARPEFWDTTNANLLSPAALYRGMIC
jgi:hypothetical protein